MAAEARFFRCPTATRVRQPAAGRACRRGQWVPKRLGGGDVAPLCPCPVLPRRNSENPTVARREGRGPRPGPKGGEGVAVRVTRPRPSPSARPWTRVTSDGAAIESERFWAVPLEEVPERRRPERTRKLVPAEIVPAAPWLRENALRGVRSSSVPSTSPVAVFDRERAGGKALDRRVKSNVDPLTSETGEAGGGSRRGSCPPLSLMNVRPTGRGDALSAPRLAGTNLDLERRFRRDGRRGNPPADRP